MLGGVSSSRISFITSKFLWAALLFSLFTISPIFTASMIAITDTAITAKAGITRNDRRSPPTPSSGRGSLCSGRLDRTSERRCLLVAVQGVLLQRPSSFCRRNGFGTSCAPYLKAASGAPIVSDLCDWIGCPPIEINLP